MENRDDNRVFSTTVKAGRRTYFLDLKKTSSGSVFLTITESKKFTDFETGNVRYEKHKIFLYPEDFDKFQDAFDEAITKAKELNNYNEE